MQISARIKCSLLAVLVLSGLSAFAQTCQTGDCQQGAISGPFTAAQKAENTASNFSICTSSTCTTGKFGTGIYGIDAQQNIGTQYQFWDKASNFDDNIAVGQCECHFINLRRLAGVNKLRFRMKAFER